MAPLPSSSPIVACFQRMQQNANRQTTLLPSIGHTTNSTPPEQNAMEQTNSAVDQSDNPARPTATPQSTLAHQVLTIAQRTKIVEWMRDEASSERGDTRIASRAVKHFPQFFRSSANANLIRASRLWKNRDQFGNDGGGVSRRGVTSSLTRVTKQGYKRVYVKARQGRGRKRTAWVAALYLDLVSEFEPLRKLGVKFNLRTLRALANFLIVEGANPAYGTTTIDERSGQHISSRITPRWIQSFTEAHRIVSRALTGKHLSSPAKELFIEKEVAYHLGKMKRQFCNNQIDENDIENADETHFVINLDKGRTLGFAGEEEVKYADVVSGGEGMTMVVRLSGGRDAQIEAQFMVFKNRDRNYPIRGTPDNVPGVSYGTGPKGWMDTKVMPEWLREWRVISKLPHGRKRILYVDSCSGHNDTPELAAAQNDINTEIRYFPKNATHLIQPCDSFVIQKIKRAWSTRWEEYKMGMIQRNKWSNGSGSLLNPGKKFFLKPAADSVREVNQQRDENQLSYARKAMIRTGMALNIDGVWEEAQLFPRLQAIIEKHRNHFDGLPVMYI